MRLAADSEESEKVSELKSMTGSNKLPYGTLASGSEGIRDAITGFEDAYVPLSPSRKPRNLTSFCTPAGSQISRTSVSLQNFSTQKKAQPTPPTPKPPPKASARRSPHPALSQALKPSSTMAALWVKPQAPQAPRPPSPRPRQARRVVCCRSSAVTGDRRAWVRR